MRRHVLFAVMVVIALLVGACGSKPSSNDGATTRLDSVSVSGQPDAKPTITISDQAPPGSLQVQDLIEGSGAEAVAGKQVTVQYVGVAWSTRKQFDASWDRGQPFSFPLGVGQVIPGWDQGVAGMKAGGRRLLVIPPELGYGAGGFPPVIEPNETLVFVIDLVAVG